jgi:hypothetical protein
MADTKISALPASTTPLAGTEVLPIVQSGATKQVSVANLTAGRAISATELTLTTGNLIVSNGKGIDFSATPGTGTSELLADYEEGTWTVVFSDASSGGNLSPTTGTGVYTKVGRLVTATFNASSVVTTGMTAGNPFYFTLPFAIGSSGQYSGCTYSGSVDFVAGQTSIIAYGTPNQSRVFFLTIGDNVVGNTVLVSALTSGAAGFVVTMSYFV